jgi:iron complex transport system ATP-binding protein
MLEIKQATFGYKSHAERKIVLEDFDLTLDKGQLICLLGANGAGKTTVFKTILGQLPPLQGQLLLDGAPLSAMDPRTRARKIAYVPQQHVPPFPYTVRQVVEMGRCVHIGTFSAPSSQDQKIAEKMLERLGILDLRHCFYTELSGGERQLVLIARALAQEADYLLLDEPTASLDYGNQAKLLREIGNLTADGIGVCMILHDPEQALALDRDAAVILDRQHALHGRARDLITPDLLRRLYGVQAELHIWQAADGRPVQSIYTHM